MGKADLSIWLLDPTRFTILLSVTQFAIWFVAMPENIEGPLPGRYWSPDAFIKFVAIFLCFLGGIRVGKGRATLVPLNTTEIHEAPQALAMQRYVLLALLVTLASFAVLLSAFFLVPGRLSSVLEYQGVGRTAIEMKRESPTGLLSISQLWMFAAAIAFQVIYGVKKPPRLVVYGLFALFVALVLFSLVYAARTVIVYFFLIWLVAFLRSGRSFQLRKACIFAVATGAVCWIGAMSRTGIELARNMNESVFSFRVQQALLESTVAGYVSGEFNRGLIMLDMQSFPERNWAYSTWFSIFGGAEGLPIYLSTVHSFGNWWIQFGYGATILALLLGTTVGGCYAGFARARTLLDTRVTIYLVVFPGVFGMIRFNYWLNTVAILPLLAALAFRFWSRARFTNR